ncbi:protein translocase subunit SecF [Candidatus Woesearchaeota archaeon]|nr:protein translocase subunit SecF [Candidatus Woesearchaeota archaeon]
MSKRSRRKKLWRLQQETEQPGVQQEAQPEETEHYTGLKGVYYRHYKILTILPLILLALALFSIALKFAFTGDFVNRGVSLKGGITVTVSGAPIDAPELREYLLEQFPGNDIEVRSLSTAGAASGFIVDADIQTKEGFDELLAKIQEKTGISSPDYYNVAVMGSSLGQSFFKEILIALGLAFLFMAIVVTLYFRLWVPSIAVILAAFSDIVMTLAVFNLLGLKLSSAGIAAFLMLIGYSVDTDILLTTRVLKRTKGTVFQRTIDAMKTGLTMTVTTMVAVLAAMILTPSEVLRQIMIVLFIGLIFDIINTWLQNAGILRWYAEKQATRERK